MVVIMSVVESGKVAVVVLAIASHAEIARESCLLGREYCMQRCLKAKSLFAEGLKLFHAGTLFAGVERVILLRTEIEVEIESGWWAEAEAGIGAAGQQRLVGLS